MCALCELISQAEGGGIPVIKLSDLKRAFAEAEGAEASAKDAKAAKPEDTRSAFDRLEVGPGVPLFIEKMSEALLDRFEPAERTKRLALVEEIHSLLLPLAAVLKQDAFVAMIKDLRGDVSASMRVAGTTPDAEKEFIQRLADRLMKPPVREEKPSA